LLDAASPSKKKKKTLVQGGVDHGGKPAGEAGLRGRNGKKIGKKDIKAIFDEP